MTVGIVGLGLIGGSMAKAYHAAGWTVLAWNRSQTMLDFAIMSGAVDAPLTEESLPRCDLLLVALYLTVSPKGGASSRKWMIWCAIFFLSRYAGTLEFVPGGSLTLSPPGAEAWGMETVKMGTYIEKTQKNSTALELCCFTVYFFFAYQNIHATMATRARTTTMPSTALKRPPMIPVTSFTARTPPAISAATAAPRKRYFVIIPAPLHYKLCLHAELCQHREKILRQGGFKLHKLPGAGVDELEEAGVEALTLQALFGTGRAVEPVT